MGISTIPCLVNNSTIFKEQLKNISTVLNNTGNTTQLLTSFNALDTAQQKVLLSSKLLTEEQKVQCLTMATLSSANTKYTAEQLAKATGISAETLVTWGLTDATDTLTMSQLAEIASSDAQAKKVLEKIVAQNAQSVANGEVTASNIALASSEGGVTLATGAFTTAIKANIKAMWTWMTTTPIGWLTLLAGGVATVIGLYDLFTTSIEEQKEKMEESLSAYEDAKSELSSVTTELESQEQAMDELLAKGKLTYAEKGQLEELQAITQELRIQKDLAEKEEGRTKKEVATDTSDLFKKQFGKYDISEGAINEYQNNADITGNNAILISDENDISAMIAGYRQFNELLDEAYGEGNQENIDHFKSLTDDLKDSIFATAQDLQEQQSNISDYYNTIKDVPYEELTSDQKEIVDSYNAISNAIALIYKQLDPNTWNEMQIDNLFATEGVEKTKEELVEMAKEGTLDEKTIQSYSKLNSTLENSNIVLEDGQSAASALCDEMYALADAEDKVKSSTSNNETDIPSIIDSWNSLIDTDEEELKNTRKDLLALAEAGQLTEETFHDTAGADTFLDGISESLPEVIEWINQLVSSSTQIQSMSSQISKMSDMLADKKNGTTASASDLAGFDATVKGLDSWEEFERLMGSSKSSMEQCQKAANALATEWVNSNNFLAQLTESNKDYYTTQLKNMGVENASAVVKNALALKEQQLALETEYSTAATEHNTDAKNTNAQVSDDLSNATINEVLQLAKEKGWSDSVTQSLVALIAQKRGVNASTLNFSGDISNLLAYVKAIGGACSALQTLNNMKSGKDMGVTSLAQSQMIEKSAQTEFTSAVKKYEEQISAQIGNVKVNPVGSSGYKGSGSKSKSNSDSKDKTKETKQTIDWIERKISSLNSNIDLTESKLNNLFNIKTPKGLSKQITDVSNKLKKASENTDKWKSKLSKIKIPDSAKKLIQDGKDVNLSKYSKAEQKNIKKYQNTWNNYSSAKKKENSLYNQKWDLETQKGKEALLKSQEKDYNTLAKVEEKAYKKYMSKAKSVKLSSSLKKKVQSGDYKISDYSSKTQSLIQEYQDWWDKAQDANKGKYEAKKNAKDKRIERYQLYVDDAEAKIAKSQALAELDAGNYKEQNKQLEKQKKYLKESYDWQIKIAKENGKNLEADKLRSEYQKELNDLTKQEFDNIANTYDNKIGLNNNKIQAFQDQISLLEARGQQVGSALYTKQMSLNNVNEEKLIAERAKLIQKLAKIPKGTDNWYAAQDTLFSVESELVNIQIENANLQKSINQLKFDRFDDLLDKLNDVVDETNFLKDMLSDNLFDDNGMITDDGITAMGLTAQNYDVYLAEAEKYKQMLSDVKDMYDAGKISLSEYEELQRKYSQSQRDAIKNANEAKKAVISYVKDGLDAQNKALEEAVNKQKELLQQEKD